MKPQRALAHPLLRRVAASLAALLLWVGSSHGAGTSAGYRIERDYLGSVGGRTGSAAYRTAAASLPCTTSLGGESDSYRVVAGVLQPSLNSFLLTVLLTGSGSVNSSPAGIACTGGVCTATFQGGTPVTLMQIPGSGYLFAGWSGACSNTTGNCSVTMDGPRTVAAAYDPVPLVRLVGSTSTSHTSVQGAYNAAASGNVLQGRDLVLAGNFLADQAKTVTVRGGYDPLFSTPSGFTILDGTVTIRSGKVVADRMKVR